MREDQLPKSASLEVACLCNLALACTKLGLFDEAEEACSRALVKSPTCSKALYRRGQARLAAGQLLGAANDFRVVANMEPNNIEVEKMLGRVENVGARVEMHGGARFGCEDIEPGAGRETNGSMPDMHQAHSRKCCLDENGRNMQESTEMRVIEASRSNLPICGNTDSNRESGNSTGQGNRLDIDAIIDTNIKDTGEIREVCEEADGGGLISPSPELSSFMVTGWLSSTERANAEKNMKHNGDILSSKVLKAPSDSLPATSVGEGTVNNGTCVSKLVHGLKQGDNVNRKGKTQRTLAQVEWSSLKAEEAQHKNAVQQRTGCSIGGKSCTPERRSAVGRKTEEAKKSGRHHHAQDRTRSSGGCKDVLQTSQWASLVEEERQVKEAFRAKLRIGKKHMMKSRPYSHRLET